MIDPRKRHVPMRLAVTVLLVAPVSFAAIGAGARASAPRPPEHAAATTTISSRHTKDGVILVGPRGQTLYLFNRDVGGTSTCYGRCARAWRPLRASARVIAMRGSGVKQRWLSTTRRRDGILQVTYDHHPLYVDAGDAQPGNLKGDEAHEFGGRWYVMPIGGPKRSCVGRC